MALLNKKEVDAILTVMDLAEEEIENYEAGDRDQQRIARDGNRSIIILRNLIEKSKLR